MAKTPKEPEKNNAPAVSGGDILPENQQPEQTAIPPQPMDATRPGEVEQIVYLNLSELHPFKNHPFEVREEGYGPEDIKARPASEKGQSYHRHTGPVASWQGGWI